MAWSYGARYVPALPGHTHKHCGNCLEYAENWHEKIQTKISKPKQIWLFYWIMNVFVFDFLMATIEFEENKKEGEIMADETKKVSDA